MTSFRATANSSAGSITMIPATRRWLRCCLPALVLAAVLPFPCARAQGVQRGAQAVYTDALKNGWVPYGYATINYGSVAPVHSGTASISVSAGAGEALYLHHQSFNTRLYTALTFWIHGGPDGGQALRVQATRYQNAQTQVLLDPLPANAWRQVSIPLSHLGVAGNADGSQNVMDGF